MSRLQKKCVLGATTMHALLLLALLVGPAFFHQEEEPLDLTEITIEPSILTDSPFSNEGGAKPGGQVVQQSKPEQPVAEPKPPTPEPPKTEPAKKEEVAAPEPVKPPKPQPKTVEAEEPKLTDRDSDKVQKPKPVHQVKVNTDKRVKLSDKTASTAKTSSTAKANTNTSNNSALASALRSTRSNLGSGLSSGTDVRMPDGQGGGSGASYANYAQAIQRIYKRAYDQALAAAGDIADGQVQIETSVVILSDGTVVSGVLVSPSSNAALNSLTKRVLDSVRQVRHFPPAQRIPAGRSTLFLT
ncbi:MAG: TonB C-terminal domain-containing protein [Verrucomicrobiota bacterium]